MKNHKKLEVFQVFCELYLPYGVHTLPKCSTHIPHRFWEYEPHPSNISRQKSWFSIWKPVKINENRDFPIFPYWNHIGDTHRDFSGFCWFRLAIRVSKKSRDQKFKKVNHKSFGTDANNSFPPPLHHPEAPRGHLQGLGVAPKIAIFPYFPIEII